MKIGLTTEEALSLFEFVYESYRCNPEHAFSKNSTLDDVDVRAVAKLYHAAGRDDLIPEHLRSQLDGKPSEPGIYLWADEEGQQSILMVEATNNVRQWAFNVCGGNNFAGSLDHPQYQRGWIQKLNVEYDP